VSEPIPVVFVVDDDPAVRAAIEILVRAVDFRVQSFGSGQDFLRASLLDAPSCLVMDAGPPGKSGLDLQHELAERSPLLPIIFISGHADIPMSVRAIKAGAVEFLPKPFRNEELLSAIRQAIEGNRIARRANAELADLRARFELLTPRQRDVLGLVLTGLLNKQIAYELGISVITVKIHRGQVMHKMRAKSVADLVRMGERVMPRPETPPASA
jgi:FixJ family two-component response regulator